MLFQQPFALKDGGVVSMVALVAGPVQIQSSCWNRTVAAMPDRLREREARRASVMEQYFKPKIETNPIVPVAPSFEHRIAVAFHLIFAN